MSLPAKPKAKRRLSQQEMVLDMLQKAGPRGCTGDQLSQVTWRFSSPIHALRAKGWNIQTQDQKGTDVGLYVLLPGTYTEQRQLDALQPRPPFRPAQGMVTGVCTCRHMKAWHHMGTGFCRECPCNEYRAEE